MPLRVQASSAITTLKSLVRAAVPTRGLDADEIAGAYGADFGHGESVGTGGETIFIFTLLIFNATKADFLADANRVMLMGQVDGRRLVVEVERAQSASQTRVPLKATIGRSKQKAKSGTISLQ